MKKQKGSALIVVMYVIGMVAWFVYPELPAGTEAINDTIAVASTERKTDKLLMAYLVKNPTPKNKELRSVNKQIKTIIKVLHICEAAKHTVNVLD